MCPSRCPRPPRSPTSATSSTSFWPPAAVGAGVGAAPASPERELRAAPSRCQPPALAFPSGVTPLKLHLIPVFWAQAAALPRAVLCTRRLRVVLWPNLTRGSARCRRQDGLGQGQPESEAAPWYLHIPQWGQASAWASPALVVWSGCPEKRTLWTWREAQRASVLVGSPRRNAPTDGSLCAQHHRQSCRSRWEWKCSPKPGKSTNETKGLIFMKAFEKSSTILSVLAEMGLIDLKDSQGKDTSAKLLKNTIFLYIILLRLLPVDFNPWNCQQLWTENCHTSAVLLLKCGAAVSYAIAEAETQTKNLQDFPTAASNTGL